MLRLARDAGSRPAYQRQTAEPRTSSVRKIGYVVLLVAVLVLLGWYDPLLPLRLVVSTIIAFYLAYIGNRLWLIRRSKRYRFPEREDVPDAELPVYTILIPLYDEANMIGHIASALKRLDYPAAKLQALLILEERDERTIAAAAAHELPDFFETVIVPAVPPYGKPKACNYALARARGEFVVIYDAEDVPDPDQLRIAVGTFRAAERRGERLGCLQARLDFINEQPLKGVLGEIKRDRRGNPIRLTTWVSRQLGCEYNVHFRYVLPGLSRDDKPVPLGGTSNHFPKALLEEIAFPADEMPLGDDSISAWDPWNVTEDAELGSAIAGNGYRIGIIDSVTEEEAVVTARAAINQRSRWVKGYAQTSIALLRRPLHNVRVFGLFGYLSYQLQVGGVFLALLLAPPTWILTIAYIATGSDLIQQMFSFTPIYYGGLALLIVGNLAFLFIQLKVSLVAQRYETVRYVLLTTPLWWLVLWAATYIALLELVFPTWHKSWNKTAHGQQHVLLRRRLWLRLTRG